MPLRLFPNISLGTPCRFSLEQWPPPCDYRWPRREQRKKSFFSLALAIQQQSQIRTQIGVDDNADEVDSVFWYGHRGVPFRDICKPLYREPRFHHLQPRQRSQHRRRHNMVKATVPFPSNRNSHTSFPVRQFLSHNSSGAALLRLKYSSAVTLFRVDSCTWCSLGNRFNSSTGATSVGSRKTTSVSR